MNELARHLRELLSPTAKGARSFAHSTTGDDGTFTFAEIPTNVNFVFGAVCHEHGVGMSDVLMSSSVPMNAPVQIVILSGTRMSGSVHDESGGAIAGASISASVWIGVGEDSIGIPVQLGLTGEDGEYHSTPLPYERFDIRCEADGFMCQADERSVIIRHNESDHIEDFTLVKSRALTGHLVFKDEHMTLAKWSGKKLRVFATNGDPTKIIGDIRLFGTEGTVVHGNDRYEVRASVQNTVYVSVWLDGVLVGHAVARGAEPGPDVTVDLARVEEESSGAALRIRVTDDITHEPVCHFRARLTRHCGDTSPRHVSTQEQVVSDPDGEARFEKLVPGEYSVEIRADRYCPCILAAIVSDVDAAEAIQVRLRLGIALLAGETIDESGSPIQGVEVCLLTGGNVVALPSPECFSISDSRGRFEFQSVPDGEYVMIASERNYAPARVRILSGSKGVVITLRRGIDVRFRVVRDNQDVRFVSGSLRIFDSTGVPVVDQYSLSRTIIGTFDGRSCRLEPGQYVVELIAGDYRSKPFPFVARENAEVPLNVVDETIKER